MRQNGGRIALLTPQAPSQLQWSARLLRGELAIFSLDVDGIGMGAGFTKPVESGSV